MSAFDEKVKDQGLWRTISDAGSSIWDGISSRFSGGGGGGGGGGAGGAGTTSAAPAPPDLGAPNADVTAQYHELADKINRGEPVLPEDAKKYEYLFIPGLITKHYPGYMQPNMEQLKKRGLDVQMANIDTDQDVKTNADAIAAQIMAANAGYIADHVPEHMKNFVCIEQSKGGVDFAAAMALHPEIKEFIRASVSMQAPLQGAPIAGDVVHSKLASVTDPLADKTFGNKDAFNDMDPQRRKAFNEAHPYPTEIPTVSLATSSESLASPLAIPRAYMENKGYGPNDGLVPVSSAVAPGSATVHLNNMDHSQSVMSPPISLPNAPDSPGVLTEALVALALERAKKQEVGRPDPALGPS